MPWIAEAVITDNCPVAALPWVATLSVVREVPDFRETRVTPGNNCRHHRQPMNTNSPSSFFDKLRVAGASALLLAVCSTGTLEAQGAGNLNLLVSDGMSPLTQDLTPRNPYFLAVTQCATPFQGSWCAPYAFAYDESAAPGDPWSIAFESVDEHNGCGTSTGFLLPAEPQSLTNFYQACLTDPQTGQQTPNEVFHWMDPQLSLIHI